MSELILDEAIKHCLEAAEQEESIINYPHSDIVLGDLDIESRKHFMAEQKQLAEWLTELKELREKYREVVMEGEILNADYTEQVALNEQYKNREEQYKRLMKLALEDLRLGRKCQFCKHLITGYADICYWCHFNTNKWEWRYADEALKLIGDEPNGI